MEQLPMVESHGALPRHENWILGARRQFEDAQRLSSGADSVDCTGRDSPSAGTSGAPAFLLPGYQIVREVHRGGQGVVYESFQQSTRRRVAVKVMREGPFAGPADRARFDREVQILAQLRHPHIVAIHDSGHVEGHDYFVMDLVEGRPLDRYFEIRERSKNRKGELKDDLRLFAKVCDAVNAAHLRGIIHRDLKPGNVLVDAAGEPQVLDFGLARFADGERGEEEVTMTATGQFVGSLPWSSPEQVEGQAVDLRTDVYSLGVMLYQCLTGRFPYSVTGRPTEVSERVRTQPPSRPRSLCPALDADVETLALKCLAKERERRYQSAGELAADLRRYLAGEPIEARRDSSLYVLRKTLRRYRGRVAAAAAFVLLLAVSAVVAWMQSLTAKRAEALARDERDSARRISDFYSGLLLNLDPWSEGAMKAGASPADIRLPDLLREAVRRIPTSFRDRPDLAAGLQRNIGRAFNGLASPEEAERIFRESHEAARQALGEDHPATLELLRNLGNSLVNRAALDEGLRVLQDAAERTVRVLGEDHAQSLLALMSLNWPMRVSDQVEESERLSRRVVAIAQRTLSEDDPLYIEALTQHATVLMYHHKAVEGERFARQAVELARRISGGRSIYLAFALDALSMVLRGQQRWAEALAILQETAEIRRAIQGENHIEYLRSLGCSLLLARLGRCEEAVALGRKLEGSVTSLYGAERYESVAFLGDLALALVICGQAAEAERLTRERLEQFGSGASMPEALCRREIGCALAAALEAQGKTTEAEATATEALREVLPATVVEGIVLYIPELHPLLGRCFLRLGLYAEAEWRLLDAHRRLNSAAKPTESRAVVLDLIALYEFWNKPEQAAQWRALLNSDAQPKSE